MDCFSTATAPERRNLTGKNRVWDFFPLSNETHPANRRQPAQPRRKIAPTAMKPASGIPYWPSRDPIGETGGLNLYGFVENDAINEIEILGFWFADGSPKKGLKELNAFGLTYLKGDGDYTYDYERAGLSMPEQTAVQNHEKLHGKQAKASNQKHAVPYKHLFCRGKGAESKYYYYSAEEGSLKKTDWSLGKLSNREEIRKNLLWKIDTAVYPGTEGEYATAEYAAHDQEIKELLGITFKQGAIVNRKENNGPFFIEGEALKGVTYHDSINFRITGVLAPRREAFSKRMNDPALTDKWRAFKDAYRNEKVDAANHHEDFSWPIPEIIYTEIK